MNLIERIEEICKPYINLNLECDGLTRVLSHVLNEEGIKHQILSANVFYRRKPTEIFHFWIRLENGLHLDYRLRMWLGENADIPHGIFNPKDFDQIKYSGEKDLTKEFRKNSLLNFQILSS